MRSGTSCARRTIDPRSFPLPGRTITFRNCRCVVTRVRVIVSVRKRVCAQAFASVCWCIAFRHYRCARVLCAYMWAGFAPAAAVLRVGCCGAFLARALSPHHVCFPICMPISR